MSMRRACYNSIHAANTKLGGAKASRATRNRHGREFADFCLQHRFELVSIAHLQPEWLQAWINSLKETSCSVATIHNMVSSVRALARAAGADLLKLGILDNRSLELPQRSRAGTKLPITDERFFHALETAQALGELGFFHMLRLERYLGLRGLESLMSTHALEGCAKQAKYILEHADLTVHVKDGTKGGRPRLVTVIAKYAAETFEAIIEALRCAKDRGGFLLQGPKGSGLKGARQKYHRLAVKAGLTGEFAPHSLRYRYCIDKLEEMREAGIPRDEALRLASEALGHGGSRGRYITMVYGRTTVHLYPKTTRVKNIDAVMRRLEALKKPDELDCPD